MLIMESAELKPPFPRDPMTLEQLLGLSLGVVVTITISYLVFSAVIAAMPRLRSAARRALLRNPK